jgi:hypothetical protein
MPATAVQASACHPRSLNVSSNSARANSQNTTTFAVDSAISGARHGVTGVANPRAELTAWATVPKARAIARRPAAVPLKSRANNAASNSSNATVPARKAISHVASDIEPALIVGLRWF